MSIIPLCIILSITCTIFSDTGSCNINHHEKAHQKFVQKVSRFWEFNNQTNSWVEVKLPYNLVSCISDDCTVVASIQEHRHQENSDVKDSSHDREKHGLLGQETTNSHQFLPLRKRVSLTRMSETSIWITGESGSIYERFWNGIQWVIAPHDLPLSAGYAVSVFIINQTILALSEAGFLYQMKLNEESQPIWVEFVPEFDKGTSKGTDRNSDMHISSGSLSNSREKMYFCTKNGLLLELTEVDPPRWVNHGRPPGAKAAVITDAAMIRPELLFVVSSVGDLYEYDRTSKPPWKKHIHREESKMRDDTSLIPKRVCTSQGLFGSYSVSFFLLSKGGELLERRLNRRKWKWIVHGNPNSHPLTSITCNSQDDHGDNPNSVFLTSASGFVFEYHIQESPGRSKDQDFEENWVNHMHPPHSNIARGIPGLQIDFARTIFPLHDGRLGELHLSGFGGERLGPNPQIFTRRKSLPKYVWSILDAPESEGWNAEYCTEERGPSNCLLGTKDEISKSSPSSSLSSSRRRKDIRAQQSYLLPSIDTTDSGEEYYTTQDYKTIVKQFFRLRLMQEGISFFLIPDNGLTFEYLNTENVWFWLRHEHPKKMEGIAGNYNGSLFLVDEHGSLLVRERSSNELAWINCTAMRKGKRVSTGSPWDVLPGRGLGAKPEDSIFLVSKSGRLLQLTVALEQYKWKDCKNPPNTKIAIIADQEGFRENIVFVIAKNGRLYQYNKVTELWHKHYQSQHLVLSRSPGTSMRLSSSSYLSVKGSIFMLSENGGLVEYKYGGSLDGWDWIEHGTPSTNVRLVGAPGPCFLGGELFLIGSDGNVYLRYWDLNEWKWRNCGFPYYKDDGNGKKVEAQKDKDEEVCIDKELGEGLRYSNKNCNSKVASTRPITSSEDSVIFELQDGRLAEMKHMEDRSWIWSRTIDTPTSSCLASFWTYSAS